MTGVSILLPTDPVILISDSSINANASLQYFVNVNLLYSNLANIHNTLKASLITTKRKFEVVKRNQKVYSCIQHHQSVKIYNIPTIVSANQSKFNLGPSPYLIQTTMNLLTMTKWVIPNLLFYHQNKLKVSP